MRSTLIDFALADIGRLFTASINTHWSVRFRNKIHLAPNKMQIHSEIYRFFSPQFDSALNRSSFACRQFCIHTWFWYYCWTQSPLYIRTSYVQFDWNGMVIFLNRYCYISPMRTTIILPAKVLLRFRSIELSRRFSLSSSAAAAYVACSCGETT